MKKLSELIFDLLFNLLTLIGVLLFWLFDYGFILAFPLMFAWNQVIPSVTNLGFIDYWQALSLYVIFNILFKSKILKNDNKKN